MIIDNIQTQPEKAYIIIPVFDKYDEYRYEEMKALVESSGAIFVGSNAPVIREINPATIIGKGKVQELRDEIYNLGADLAIYDGDLSPSQTLNLASGLDVKVIDRTTLILDIFAQRAKTEEGKLQVKLAQLRYMYPRLKGKGEGLSQQGGGIGTRGPGETKLETDRRHIKNNITFLETAVKNLAERRKLQTERRNKNDITTVALVGYTNVGKSTLINLLTDSDVYAENKLFATLDPTYRKLTLENTEIVLVDTVGFLRDIPHDLIDAFKSTLESATEADLILNIADIKNNPEMQLEVTKNTLNELKCDAPVWTVYNKCDGITDFSGFDRNAIFISAKTGLGIDVLKRKLNDFFSEKYKKLKLCVPFENISEFNKLRTLATITAENYTDDGLQVEITVATKFADKFKKFN